MAEGVDSSAKTGDQAGVDFEAGEVRLYTSKNGKPRVFPFALLPQLVALLRSQREAPQADGHITPYVFHRNGRPIRDFRGTWDRACKTAHLDGLIPHDLRRSAVRRLERAGVSRLVAMQLTGHKTEAVYRRYAIVAKNDLDAGVAKLAALSPDSPPAVVPFPPRTGTFRAQ